MQELIISMMRFSAAMTLFGMQQLQNAVGAAADTQSAVDQFRKALDDMSDTVTQQMDVSKQETLKSMTNAQKDLIGNTFDAMNVRQLDPRELMNTGGDLMRKTSDSLADLVKKATAPMAKAASEPAPGVDALGRH